MLRTALLALVICFGSAHALAGPGVTSHEIKIISAATVSGIFQDYGKSLSIGANTYYSKINAQGGVFGRKINLNDLSDASDTMKALKEVQTLIEEQTDFAMVGGIGNAGLRAVLPSLEKDKMPLLFPYSGGEFLRQPTLPNVFNLRVGHIEETDRLIEYLASVKHVTDIGIVYEDDAIGLSIRDSAVRAMALRGFHPKRSVGRFPTETNFKSVAEEMKAANVAAIFLAGTEPFIAPFLKAMNEIEFKPLLIGPSAMGAQVLQDEIQKEKLTLIFTEVVPLPTDTGVPVVAEYQADIKKSPVQPKLASVALEGYIGAKAFVEILKRTGQNLTREALISTIEKMKDYDLGGIPCTFSPEDHQGFHKPYMFTLDKDGIRKL